LSSELFHRNCDGSTPSDRDDKAAVCITTRARYQRTFAHHIYALQIAATTVRVTLVPNVTTKARAQDTQFTPTGSRGHIKAPRSTIKLQRNVAYGNFWVFAVFTLNQNFIGFVTSSQFLPFRILAGARNQGSGVASFSKNSCCMTPSDLRDVPQKGQKPNLPSGSSFPHCAHGVALLNAIFANCPTNLAYKRE
jgi:hypothetical protein